MTTAADLATIAREQWMHAPPDQWWKRTAAKCLAEGAVQIITGGRGAEVYLLRCWLSCPRLIEAAGPADGARFESGSALLLHQFFQPDDDGALHDHPWEFTTRLLHGGYRERRPVHHPDPRDPDALGPAMTWYRWHVAGDEVKRRATDLHAVVELMPDTWTMVQTGPRVRSWFFHPTDQKRVPWRDYLAALGKDVPPRTASASA